MSFKSIAQETTVLCKLQAGRTKLDSDGVVDKVLTITAFDFAPKMDENNRPLVDTETGEVEVYGVVTFKEMPDRYYNVGKIFTKVCKAWAAGYSSPEEASEALAEEGGVKVKFSPGKTKSGNNLTTVEIVD